jgi:hypothetical protein
MQRGRTVRRILAAVAASAMATTVLVMATADHGAAAPREEHCVVRIVGQAPDGELRTTTPTCKPTRSAALGASGARAAGDFPIGYHYDGYSLTGSSFVVVGTGCIGGWLNLPPEWINRVSSTLHGCGHIRHFDKYDLVSPNQMTIYPGGNLLSLNNRTNSIQYLP